MILTVKKLFLPFALIFALKPQVGFFDHVGLEQVGGFSFHDDAAGLQDIGIVGQLQGFLHILLHIRELRKHSLWVSSSASLAEEKLAIDSPYIWRIPRRRFR